MLYKYYQKNLKCSRGHPHKVKRPDNNKKYRVMNIYPRYFL